MKDGKKHVATVKDVSENKCFTYTAPLPGSKLVAIHALEALDNGDTRITHSFDFTGIGSGVYGWLTKDYVQNGLEQNTAALRVLAEREAAAAAVEPEAADSKKAPSSL
jgi:hypothetical protein